MKNIIIILSVLIFVSCATITKYESDLKIIKFKKLGVLKYDYYSSFKIQGNYCIYITDAIDDNSTNYIYGDFELLDYNEYLQEKD